MSYIGNPPAERFTSFDYQDLTGGTGTSFTLTHPVGNAQEILVMVNNVVQEPGVAYTVSGTALTMTGSIASTDDFYVVYRGKAIQTATHPSDRALTATDGTFTGDLTVDNNTLVGQSSDPFPGVGNTVQGISLHNSGRIAVSSDGNTTAYLNRKTSDGTLIDLRKDGSTVGKIGLKGGNPFLVNAGSRGISLGSNLVPCDNTGVAVDNASNIGTSSARFKDLYLSGGAYIGGTGSANFLDDYEESSYTPAFVNGTFTYTNQYGWVSKIGSLVTVGFAVQWSAKSGSGEVRVTLPVNTPSTSNFWRVAGNVGYMADMDYAGYEQMSWTSGPNSSSVELRLNKDNSTPGISNVSNMGSSGEIQGTISYRIND